MTAGQSAARGGTPLAEIDIDPGLVAGLIAAQHPDLADLPIVAAASGWDNAMFRLGDHLAVRLPHRETAAALIANEQRWLPALADALPLRVPVPLRTGEPQGNYPWPWSVTPWFEGETADLRPPGAGQGEALGRFFEALHRPAPDDAPRNPFRGVRLADRSATFELRLGRLAGRTDSLDARLLDVWGTALAEPIDVGPTWIHGDPHPRNVLVAGARISAVLDWGDIAQGDRAADLAGVWMLLPGADERRRAIAACPSVSDATWRRARGWAVLYGVMLLDAGLTDDPRMAEIAKRTFERVLAGP